MQLVRKCPQCGKDMIELIGRNPITGKDVSEENYTCKECAEEAFEEYIDEELAKLKRLNDVK